MKPRICLSTIITTVSGLFFTAGQALAYETVEVDHFKYKIVSEVSVTDIVNDKYFTETIRLDKGASLIDCADEFYMPSHLVVPDEITVDGTKIPVVAIEKMKTGRDKVTKLTLGKNIIAVGDDCWDYCKLTEVNLNQNLQLIGSEAFQYNTGLTAITIPASVRLISNTAFANCALSDIVFENLELPGTDTGLTISQYAFSTNKYTTVTLPVQCHNVHPTSFGRTAELEQILVAPGNPVLRSDDGVLYQKSGEGYNAVTYPRNKSNTTFAFPEFMNGGRVLTYFIDGSTYGGVATQSITTLDFSKLKKPIVIDNEAIAAPMVTNINIQNVDSIYDRGLDINHAQINIGAATRYVSPTAFSTQIKTFTVDAGSEYYKASSDGSLIKILDNGLSLVRPANPGTITKYTVPEGVTEIGMMCFYFCEQLTELTLSDAMQTICQAAFYGCRKLEKINVPGTALDYIDAQALLTSNTGYWWSTNPTGAVYIGNVLFHWKGDIAPMATVTVKNGTPVISPSCFSNYYAMGVKLAYQYSYQMKEVVLPSSVKKIYQYAFADATSMEKINIPQDVEYIGEGAFHHTGISAVNVPDGVKYIGDYAFNRCDKATQITIGSFSSQTQTVLGKYAFGNSPNVSKLLIGGNVTEIGDFCFRDMGINADPLEIDIPAGVSKIGLGAFYGVNIKELHIRALTPPQVTSTESDNLFNDEVYQDIPLFVPAGKVNDYKAAPGWNKFRRILNEGDDPAAIENIGASNPATITVKWGKGLISIAAGNGTEAAVYTADGTTIYTGKGNATIPAAPGLYIIKAAGQTFKGFVK